MNSIQKGDSIQTLEICREYLERGQVSFEKVLAIDRHARIPNLTHVYGLQNIHALVTLLLTRFSDSLNLIRPMNGQQLIECAYELVLTSEEDQLSIEDYVLFFKGAKEGKYGKILDRLDQQTVFAMLEEYRQERHRQYLRIREARHIEQKATGLTDRVTANNAMEESFYNIAGRLGEMKEKLKEQREVNRMQKWQKDL